VHAEDVVVGVAEPGGLEVSDRGDAVLRLDLREVVVLEAKAAAAELIHGCPDVVHLPGRKSVLAFPAFGRS
jgi:hypothetical protein